MGNFCLGRVGAEPGETKCGGKGPYWIVEWLLLVRRLCSNRRVLMPPQRLRWLLSWLAGCANPGLTVYPVQKVFGCKGDEPTWRLMWGNARSPEDSTKLFLNESLVQCFIMDLWKSMKSICLGVLITSPGEGAVSFLRESAASRSLGLLRLLSAMVAGSPSASCTSLLPPLRFCI